MPVFRVTIYYHNDNVYVEAPEASDAFDLAIEHTETAIDTYDVRLVDEQTLDPLDRATIIRAEEEE
jgi:hypothetical protein